MKKVAGRKQRRRVGARRRASSAGRRPDKHPDDRAGAPALLPVKLTRPRPTHAAPRPRLFRRLDRARKNRLVWIAAPAGYGKTTLAASYLARSRGRVLWYQADTADTDPAAFFYYLAQAVRSQSLPLFTPEYQADLPAFTRNFFRALFARIRPRWIVIDNFQEAETGALPEILALAADEIPAGVTLIVLSRNDPPPAFARLRAAGALAVLDSTLLRLSLSEARDVATRHAHGAKLPPQALRNLYETSDGWAAGLVLLLAQWKATETSIVRPASNASSVFDYFAAELLTRAGPALQSVLLKTSLFDDFSAGMATVLTGDPRAPQWLDEAVHRNYFIAITGHPGDTIVYRYHPLFQAFLRRRARDMLESGEYAALSAQAARLLADAGQPERAAVLLIEGGSPEALADFIAAQAPALSAQGRGQALLVWIAALPASVLAARADLRFWKGVCLMPSDPAAAYALFAGALDALRAAGATAAAWQAWCAMVETVLLEGRSFAPFDVCLERHAEMTTAAPVPASLEDAVTLRRFIALYMRQPLHPEFAACLRRVEGIAQTPGDPATRVLAAAHLVTHGMWAGDFARATRYMELLAGLYRNGGLPPLFELFALTTDAMHAWLVEADEAKCLRLVETALARARETGVHLWDSHLLGHGVAGALTAGDTRKAAELLAPLTVILGQLRPLDAGYYHFLCMWQALAQKDLPRALAHFDLTHVIEVQLEMPYGSGLFSLVETWAQEERGDLEAALKTCERAQSSAAAAGSRALEMMALLGRAGIAQRQADPAMLAQALARAFAIGRAHNVINFHLWQPVRMAGFCALALERNIETDYVRGLIRRRQLVPSGGFYSEAWPWPVRIHALGGFTLVVDGKAVQAGGKGRKKPLELLKTIIAFGGRAVPVELLAAELWPEAEGDAAANLFKITLHRLRELLGCDALELAGGRLVFRAGTIWVDAWALERALAAQADSGPMLERAFEHYRGTFLNGEPQPNVAILKYRERLHRRLLAAVKPRLGQLARDSDWAAAVALCERALDFDEMDEDLYEVLAQTQLLQGKRLHALRTLDRAEKLFASLKLPLSPPLTELRRRVCNDSNDEA